MRQSFRVIDPIKQNESMQAILRMRQCRKFYMDYLSNNPLFEDYFLKSFMVNFKFALDFLLDMDIVSSDLHHDLTTDNRCSFVGQHFLVDSPGYPQLRFHYTCNYSNIVINFIDQLNINLS